MLRGSVFHGPRRIGWCSQLSVLPQPRRTFASSSSVRESDNIYIQGLKKTEFTNDLCVSKETPTIPIFRVMNYDGQLDSKWECPFNDEELVDMMKFMVKMTVWDDMLYNIQRQGRISFYIQNMGEEAAQLGSASALSVEDHLCCQYRELGVLMWRGFTLENVLDQCFSNHGDEGKGRQMPISYSKRDLNIQAISTPLTTQVPHAAGSGYAFKNNKEKRCAVAFFGEGAASEGDFHAALNFAAVTKSQTIFVCRNNGYAISTPVKDQYAGDGIAIRGIAYGMETVRVDGNDLFAVHIAMKKARDICVNKSEPVLLEYMTYRMGHHSTSDDASQYRPEGEYDAWNQPGVNPLARYRKYLESRKLWDMDTEKALRAEAKSTMLAAVKKAEKKKKIDPIQGMFEDVYDEMPWHLKEQAESLSTHLKTHKEEYDTSQFQSPSS